MHASDTLVGTATPDASARRQRVALFTKDLRGGGAERVTVHLARALAESGSLDVDLILTRAVGPNLQHVAPGVRIVDLGARQMLTSLPGLVRYLRRERPSVILSALEHANVVALMARALSGTGGRVVVSIHNNLSRDYTVAPSLKKRVEAYFVRAFYPLADAIVAVSSGVADDLAQLTGIARAKIDVIYNPVVSDAMIARSREPLDHSWLVPGAPPVILNVGRLTAQKDQAMLLRAFALLRRAAPARLVILGEGEEREALQQIVRELNLTVGIGGDVLLPGFADNPYAWMSRAAVLALSSRYEGLPTVLIEALACGCQVVSTDCPSGPDEILAHGKWGRLTPVGDAEAFAGALRAALETPIRPQEESWKPFEAKRSADAYQRVLLPDLNAGPGERARTVGPGTAATR